MWKSLNDAVRRIEDEILEMEEANEAAGGGEEVIIQGESKLVR